MSSKQKQKFLKNIILDQLLTSEPASLSIDTILKGVKCKFSDYSQEDLLALLDDMSNNRELLKLIDAESGLRFKLSASQIVINDQEDC